uniref:PLD phosphodiesterase domain-containing protein n=1 Tax=Rhabditophanes sp. KR3021 TaxID=114890 RepID=A0AC35U324_9BILA
MMLHLLKPDPMASEALIKSTVDGRPDMTNFELDLFDTRMNTYHTDKQEAKECCKNSFVKPSCFPITIVFLFIFLVTIYPIINDDGIDTSVRSYERSGHCTDQCLWKLLESIPTNMTFAEGSPQHMTTFDGWTHLLGKATKSIDLAVLYWNLQENTTLYPTSIQGQQIYNLLDSAAKKGLKIRIAQNAPSPFFPQSDSATLAAHSTVEVRSLNFSNLIGSGVLHTKFWIVDQKDVYIGSANMDWKSLSEVKELGLLLQDCHCLAHDLQKVFSVYWTLGQPHSKIPPKWPLSLRTAFNFEHPLKLTINNQTSTAFIASSPDKLSPLGRQNDSDAILEVLENASSYVKIAVMDYLPTTLYMPHEGNFFWGDIDYKIRETAYRGVNIQMLISEWAHSKKEAPAYLKSLLELNKAGFDGKIEVKIFRVNSTKEQSEIPFARVNHNKYMVTDRHAYIGTSNWVGDYFLTTAGVSLIVGKDGSDVIVDDLDKVFDRDWNSAYATSLQL